MSTGREFYLMKYVSNVYELNAKGSLFGCGIEFI